MKRVLVLLIAICLAFYSQAQNKSLVNLLGVWECIDQKNDRGSIEFVDSNKVFINFMGERKQVVDYKIDFSKTPYWFAFTIKEGDESIVVKSFLYFVDDNNIKWEVFMSDDTASATTSEIVILRRKSDATAAR